MVAQGRREKAHDAVRLLPETRGLSANRAPTFDMFFDSGSVTTLNSGRSTLISESGETCKSA
jgi:hypothetical protein